MLSKKLEVAQLKSTDAKYNEPRHTSGCLPNGVKFIQEHVNYLGEYTRQDRGLNQEQVIRPVRWDKNFYKTYAPPKDKLLVDAYEEFMIFLEENVHDLKRVITEEKSKEPEVCSVKVVPTNKERKAEAATSHTYENCLIIQERKAPRKISFQIRKRKAKLVKQKEMNIKKKILYITQFLKGVAERDMEENNKDDSNGELITVLDKKADLRPFITHVR